MPQFKIGDKVRFQGKFGNGWRGVIASEMGKYGKYKIRMSTGAVEYGTAEELVFDNDDTKSLTVHVDPSKVDAFRQAIASEGLSVQELGNYAFSVDGDQQSIDVIDLYFNTKSLRIPYGKGFAAHAEGKRLADNPYSKGLETVPENFSGWEKGWMEAEKTKAQPMKNPGIVSFPTTCQYQGQTFSRTGKTGYDVVNGLPSAEYRDYNSPGDYRVWMDSNGKITEE